MVDKYRVEKLGTYLGNLFLGKTLLKVHWEVPTYHTISSLPNLTIDQ